MATAKKKQKIRVVLLDAFAIIHRAFHALPDFSSSKGEPTGALYGLMAMLLTIAKTLEPDHVIACMDLPEKTHRHDVYDGYKATRQKTDNSLSAQIEKTRDIFTAFGIPIYEAPGFEADDCLGTIVAQLRKDKDIEVVIASGDMDTLQLVDGDRVRVFTLRKGMNDTVMYNEQAVVDRFGFGPELIPDYKGLRGDPSDNIKGVKGIGEKAATELITNFGHVRDIYKKLKKDPAAFEDAGIKKRVVTLLEEGEDDAVFSTMLATIRVDAPITFQVPEKSWRESIDTAQVFALCDQFEFRSLIPRIQAALGNTDVKKKEEAVAPLSGKDELQYREAAILAWLLSSDLTNPSPEDVLRAAKATTMAEAHAALYKKVKETGKLLEVFESIERPLIPVVKLMQEIGIKVDTTRLRALSKEYHKELSGIATRITTHAGKEFNINSPAQLAEILFTNLGLSLARHKKTSTGRLSTKESELEKMRDQHPIIGDILEYREVSKLLSTYVDVLPQLVAADGRIHAEFQPTGTSTGRMSSKNPNMQNIPIRSEQGRRIRDAFVAEKGYLLVAIDYSQIELRIAAGLSGDERLVTIFKEGGDVHQRVAAQVFNVPAEMVDAEMRRRAKIINFGIMYGMGVVALRQNLGASVSREEASHFLNDYFTTFSGLAAFLDRTKAVAARQGYTETLFGRRRLFSGFSSHLPQVRAQAERMAINAPIQGTQADIIKKAMGTVYEWIKKEGLEHEVRMLLQVHDELVFEVKEEKKDVIPHLRKLMEQVVDTNLLHGVPIKAEVAIGTSWGSVIKQ